MRSICQLEYFSRKTNRAFEAATRIVDMLPDTDEDGALLRCHEVARVVHAVLRVSGARVVDGKFGGVEHSWIRFVDGPKDYILDVYAIGSLPPVQLHEEHPWAFERGKQYIEEDKRGDINDALVAKLTASVAGRVWWE